MRTGENSIYNTFQKSNKKGLMHRLVYTFVVRKHQKQIFSGGGSYNIPHLKAYEFDIRSAQ